MGLRVNREGDSQPTQDELARELLAVNSAKQELADIEGKIKTQNNILDTVNASIETLSKNILELENKKSQALLDFKKTNDENQKSLAEINSKITDAKNELSVLQNENASQKRKNQDDFDIASSQIKKLNDELDSLKNEKVLISKAIERDNQLVNIANEKIEKINISISEANSQLEDKNKKSSDLDIVIEKKENTIKLLEKQASDKLLEIAPIKEQIDTLYQVKDIKQKEIADLDSKIAEKKDEFNSLVTKAFEIVKKEERLNRLWVKIQELYKKAGVDISNEII